MSNPPGGDDDLESRKTRFVPRSDVVDADASKSVGGNRLTQAGAADATPPPASPAGTIIGRTRLVSPAARADATGPISPAAAPQGAAAPKSGMPAAAKTEFMRSDRTPVEPVVGWVVVVQGPGRGGFKPIYVGMNSVGRDPSQRICLDFGDDTISRQEHAFITYDDELRRYWVQGGGKTNVVRLGSETLTSPKELKSNDTIRIGATVLRFYPVCGADFSWTDEVGGA